MGRPKNFSRNEVLDKAIPIFWKRGFSDTSVQDLEKATGVNKSGLYSEFKDKDDLYLASLQRYIEQHDAADILNVAPMGWNNIENFLKAGLICSGQKGCFLVNSVREVAVLPAKAKQMVSETSGQIKKWMEQNIQAENPKMAAGAVADLVFTFSSGISLEQNMQPNSEAALRKISDFMQMLRRI